MTRTLPERTVDSMVAIEVVRLQPYAIVWSPTNTAGQIDHLIQNGLLVTYLECKGVEARSSIPIRLQQLWRYAYTVGPRDTVYVLPSRPAGTGAPFNRPDACCGPFCRFCPRDARSWAGLERSITNSLDLEQRLQPWFAHWAWCVPCGDLCAHLGVLPGSCPSGHVKLDWDDGILGSLPGAVRLCHFFGPSGGWSLAEGSARPAGDGDVGALFELANLGDSEESPPLVVIHVQRDVDLQ